MGGTDYCAQKCGCSWQEHMHITCEYGVVKRTIIDTNREMEIRNADDAIEAIEQTLESLKLTVEEYKEEMAIIEDIGSKFAYILVEHSTTVSRRWDRREESLCGQLFDSLICSRTTSSLSRTSIC